MSDSTFVKFKSNKMTKDVHLAHEDYGKTARADPLSSGFVFISKSHLLLVNVRFIQCYLFSVYLSVLLTEKPLEMIR